MRFNKKHLVDIKSLTLNEAQVFLGFLYLERERHIKATQRCITWGKLWHSESIRQVEEIERIDSGIEEVKEKFGIELEEK